MRRREGPALGPQEHTPLLLGVEGCRQAPLAPLAVPQMGLSSPARWAGLAHAEGFRSPDVGPPALLPGSNLRAALEEEPSTLRGRAPTEMLPGKGTG